MHCVILTRPLADSQSLARILAEHGIDCILSPVMEIQSLPATVPESEGLNGLIATSRHALAACLPLRYLPLYAVGEHTAQTAREMGFMVTAQAETAETLLPCIPAQKHYLYASGETVRLDFTRHLPHVRRIITYRAEPVQKLTGDAINNISSDRVDGVVFYSPRAAKIFTGLLHNAGFASNCAALTAFCLSGAIAECCTQLGWKHTMVASTPTQAAMVTLLANMK